MDLLEPAGTVCRASVGQCDLQETCDGGSPSCPADVFVADGAVCDDSDACNVGETCQSGACTGGSPPDCSGAGGQCNTASCDVAGAEGNCDTLAPVADGTFCDDADPCTTTTCQTGTCTFSSAAVEATVNLEIDAINTAVTRDITFVVTTCGGSVDSRTLPVSIDATGLASVVLSDLDPGADWLSVVEGHTLRRLSALSFTACVDTVDLTGAGALLSGDFQSGPILQDGIVDIVDFSQLAANFNLLILASLSTGTDATGDGVQGLADFVAIQVNFFKFSEPENTCLSRINEFDIGTIGIIEVADSGELVSVQPIVKVAAPLVSIAVRNLPFVGAARADLNGDGIVDARDIRAFARRYGLPLLPEFEQKLSSMTARLERLEARDATGRRRSGIRPR
ncbi:MAG: hypothetical protein IID33_07840 [Planctomycetes bacterium]|nr:hypothetical protein [Planctomycetota bacterium]